MKLIDLHNHSNSSPDGNNSVKEMCDRANELELYAFAITDHFEANKTTEKGIYDTDEWESYQPFLTIDESIKQIDEYNNIQSKTKILKGIEIGQAHQSKINTQKVLSLYDFDLIIYSLHNVANEVDFYWIDYKNATKQQMDALIEKYYKEFFVMSKDDCYDIIGHLTYPIRYAMRQNMGHLISIEHCKEIIIELLKNVISKGKAIEINTSGVYHNYECIPNYEYIKLFKDLGGEYITLGSDSHNKENLGKGLIDGLNLAKEAGFKYITYFEKREPKMLKI